MRNTPGERKGAPLRRATWYSRAGSAGVSSIAGNGMSPTERAATENGDSLADVRRSRPALTMSAGGYVRDHDVRVFGELDGDRDDLVFLQNLDRSLGASAAIGDKQHGLATLPRLHGTSKYGLSRIYKVLLDLISIRLVVAYANQPLAWFFKMALVPAVLAAAFTAAGIVLALDGAYSLPLFGVSRWNPSRSL